MQMKTKEYFEGFDINFLQSMYKSGLYSDAEDKIMLRILRKLKIKKIINMNGNNNIN